MPDFTQRKTPWATIVQQHESAYPDSLGQLPYIVDWYGKKRKENTVEYKDNYSFDPNREELHSIYTSQTPFDFNPSNNVGYYKDINQNNLFDTNEDDEFNNWLDEYLNSNIE